MSNLTIVDASKASKEGFFKFSARMVRELRQFRYALYHFVRKNLVSRYRRSSIGIFWSMLNPLVSMAVLTIVFSWVFKVPIENYSIYIFSGTLPWGFIMSGITTSSESIIHADTFLRKIYIPKSLFPLSTILVEFINLLFGMISLFLLMAITRTAVNWSILLLPLAMLLLLLFVSGGAIIVSIITVYFRDLRYILQVLFGSVFFYATPIIYQLDIIPKQFQWLFWLNPFQYFIELFRSIIYRAQSPSLELWLMSVVLTLVSISFGLYLLKLREKDIIYRL
jgi:ABC-type polysaccharide/polyol phosphate export permease